MFEVNQYLEFLQIKILISQVFIFFIYKNIKKYISYQVAIASTLFILFNPYLIISARNISSVYNYEFFVFLFLFLLIRRNKSIYHSFWYGLISSLCFSIYFPYIIYTTSINLVLQIKDKFKNFKQVFLGYLSGIILNIILFLPVINQINFSDFNRTRSWGLTSFWRIFLNLMSGKSINNKINHENDIKLLNDQSLENSWIVEINYFLVVILLIFSLFCLVKKIKKESLDDFELVFLSIISISGFLFTLLDRPLYPHYFLLSCVFTYIFLFKFLKNKTLLFLICIFYLSSNMLLIYNFHEFIDLNKGAINSDYGKTYESCGRIVFDASICRGQ